MRRRKKLQFDPNRDTKDFREDIVTDFGVTNSTLRAIVALATPLDYETYHRIRTYQDSGGNIREAARRLGIDHTTLSDTIKKFISDFEAQVKAIQSQPPSNQ